MVLWFLKSKDNQYRLCPIFAVVQSTLSVWLNYAIRVMYNVVRKRSNSNFWIKWLSLDEVRVSANLLNHNRPNGHLLRGIFAVMGGGRMKCAANRCSDIQNAF